MKFAAAALSALAVALPAAAIDYNRVLIYTDAESLSWPVFLGNTNCVNTSNYASYVNYKHVTYISAADGLSCYVYEVEGCAGDAGVGKAGTLSSPNGGVAVQGDTSSFWCYRHRDCAPFYL